MTALDAPRAKPGEARDDVLEMLGANGKHLPALR